MAARTRNYNLIKPDGADLVNIEDLNDNFDAIDSQLKTNADAVARKQAALTFDNTPTSGSQNPVTSGGVYAALQGKQAALTFDSAPTEGSGNPVTSAGMYAALQEKQGDLTQVPVISSLRETDYLFLERDGLIYKICASAVIIPSADDGVETESGDILLTEDGQELLPNVGDAAPRAITTQSGEQLLSEQNEVISIE